MALFAVYSFIRALRSAASRRTTAATTGAAW
jgi:hypothetical protein